MLGQQRSWWSGCRQGDFAGGVACSTDLQSFQRCLYSLGLLFEGLADQLLVGDQHSDSDFAGLWEPFVSVQLSLALSSMSLKGSRPPSAYTARWIVL